MKNKQSKENSKIENKKASKKTNKNNSKNVNKKDKKKKGKAGKIIRIILLIILIPILAYGCYFGYNYFKHKAVMGDSEYDPLSATALGIDPEKLKTIGRINVLVLGESNANQGPGAKDKTPYYLTDTIMVLSYSPQTQQASILSIPRDTYVGKKDKTLATPNYLMSYKMNSVYRNRTNVTETLECVSKVTGLNLDKCIMIDTDAIVEVVDAIGGVYFDVPIDMDYDDLNQDLHIHLKAGMQLIDGDKAEQLLRFRHNQDGSSYPVEYGDNDIGRMKTQREFIQATAKQLLKIENATKVIGLLDIVSNNVRTENLDFQELKYYIPYLFKFNTSNIVSDVLPGTPEQVNGVWIYTADKTKTKQVVEDLFTDKIEVNEEELEGQKLVNSTNEVTVNEVATNTVQAEKKDITVELVNGSGDNTLLEKVKTKLKNAGYTVSKTSKLGNTQAKTTIVNRREKENSIAKTLKETLGVGTIQTGSDNAKVDFTIILGQDYK